MYGKSKYGILAVIGSVAAACLSFGDVPQGYTEPSYSPNDWVKDGEVLKPKNEACRWVSFRAGNDALRDVEVSFDVKRIRLNSADQHFGVVLRAQKDSSLKIYCRGEYVFYQEIVGGKEVRGDAIAKLASPLGVGPAELWTRFKIICRGRQAEVYVNGNVFGIVRDIQPEVGGLSFYAHYLNAWFRNVEIKTLTDVKGDVIFRNMTANSSFEYCTELGFADYWGCPHWGVRDTLWVMRMDEWRRHFGVDGKAAYDGKQSMRLDSPFDTPCCSSVRHCALLLQSCTMGLATGRNYVVSAYMKSEPAGMKVRMRNTDLILTNKWVRYEVPLIRMDSSMYADMLMFRPMSKGVFWVDAVQVEEGGKATAYAPSLKDIQLAREFAPEGGAMIAIPDLAAPVLDDAITLDGVLDEAAWRQAKPVDMLLSNGLLPKEPTEAFVFQGNKGLYIGVRCADRRAAENRCRIKDRDGEVWNDPCLDVFVAPGNDPSEYYHMVVNQAGVQFDGLADNDRSWNGQWQAQVATTSNAWTAEMFLPYADFNIKATTCACWRLNICRENHNEQEYSCWSPTFGGFHTPERFGRIRLDQGVLDAYRLGLENVRWNYVSTNELALKLLVRNESDKDGRYEVTASLGDGKDTMPIGKETAQLKRGGAQEVCLGPVKAEMIGNLPVQVVVQSTDSMACRRERYALTRPLLLDVKSRYNLYTVESNIIVRVTTAWMKPAKLRLDVCKTGEAQSVYSRKTEMIQPGMTLICPGQTLSNGEYDLRGTLIGADGGVIAEARDHFRKLPPKKGEVKIDRFNQMLVVDGKPTLINGIALEHIPTNAELEFLVAASIKDIVVVNGPNMDYAKKEEIDRICSFLSKSDDLGMRVAMYVFGSDIQKTEKNLERFSNYSSFLMLMTFDEVFTGKGGQTIAHYEVVRDAVNRLAARTPYKVIFQNDSSVGLSWMEENHLEWPGAIVSIDHYALWYQGGFEVMPRYVKKMKAKAMREGNKPVLFFTQGGAGYSFTMGREFNEREYEYSTYTLLINGASLIYAFADYPRVKSHWEKMVALNRELRDLSPVVASIEDVPVLESSPSSIETMVRKHEGCYYIVALNKRKGNDPIKAVFNVKPFGAARTAAVLFEDRNVKIRDGILEDTFDGYQRHVYKIKASERVPFWFW